MLPVNDVDADAVDKSVVRAGQESVLIAAPVAESDSSRKQYSSSSGSSRSLKMMNDQKYVLQIVCVQIINYMALTCKK